MTYDGFPPFISAQLHYLINHFAHPVRVEQAWSGSKYSNTLDRFTLLIPYCLDTIKWDVIYNAEFPHAPPDIIFGPEDEDFHPFYNESGGEGDSRDQYMSYQRKRVGEVDDDRLKFEICTMLSREGIEMHMSSGVEKVIYPVNRKYVSAPSAPHLKLMSTPALKSLFSVDDVKLPPWLDGMCMAEYLPHLEETLERQVSEAVSLIEVRRRFIEALAPLFGRPIETDSKVYVFCCLWCFLILGAIFPFNSISKAAAISHASKFHVDYPEKATGPCQLLFDSYDPTSIGSLHVAIHNAAA
ncbi:BRCA1-A complex subunit BRE [Citrus sinensis]|uniref:BRCA1-A complex subunit BRE n=1 Tax=Citrus sinensis TaxID=2711 RepID=A0ACB8KXI3_CITSI|nr:BRCA1-A complex subunit BRE [Citrus sinensis]